ncbi:hypothetical protein Tsubulata_004305 [Turnera subulata]|uniref:Protein SHORT HYPOCOTYL IN WHITE LIGHT 1 n=1 Tax=Turnera subulata TaxID=218843 RepID=A0A9Q0IZT8_9ROSI|nr:hypothetical protein Tsubulata_004305 [Turnera subulata]
MSFTVTLPSLSPSRFSPTHSTLFSPKPQLAIRFNSLNLPRTHSRRILTGSSPGRTGIADNPRSWSRSIGSEFAGRALDGDDDDDEDEEEDRSLDLLIRFVQNVFRKISKRARKAVRSVLPVPISTGLVEFSVDGVLMLAFLWVLKAFLEVVCTLGSVVFVSILLIRGIWSGVTYLQDRRDLNVHAFDDDRRAWNGSQPAL